MHKKHLFRHLLCTLLFVSSAYAKKDVSRNAHTSNLKDRLEKLYFVNDKHDMAAAQKANSELTKLDELHATRDLLPDDPFYADELQETLSIRSKFNEAPDSLNYANYHYLGTHNAHVYYRFWEVVNQQDRHVIWQLAQGARGLMFDTYNWNNLGWPNARRGSGEVVLSHTEPGGFIARIQKGHSSYQTLKWELRRVVEWMKTHPSAVITIILEDYANASTTAKEIQEVMVEARYNPLLTINDWPINPSGAYEWPTLGWMRKNNKRLVIFTQRAGTTSCTWNQYSYCAENQYSTTDENELWKERAESARGASLPRKLVVFNNFSGIAVTQSANFIKDLVSYSTARRLAINCRQKGFAKGRIFNGYFVDRIVDTTNILAEQRVASAFDYVNQLNFQTDPTTP